MNINLSSCKYNLTALVICLFVHNTFAMYRKESLQKKYVALNYERLSEHPQALHNRANHQHIATHTDFQKSAALCLLCMAVTAPFVPCFPAKGVGAFLQWPYGDDTRTWQKQCVGVCPTNQPMYTWCTMIKKNPPLYAEMYKFYTTWCLLIKQQKASVKSMGKK